MEKASCTIPPITFNIVAFVGEVRMFKDKNNRAWSVREEFPFQTHLGVIVFSSEEVTRWCWGTPINWRDPANLKILFDLSVPLDAAA